ncbi:MAG: PQQ-binding-like beta-propeller repeat protein [Holosporales bacterium]|jgi:outer membrane protein assembly factor BamB|nr:PQQ-binding-like beta-propeller repeat protein [Holosporales bacterium]
MKHISIALFSLIILVATTACNKKVHLKGKREIFCTLSEDLKPDPVASAEGVSVAIPEANSCWTHARKDATHNVGNLECSFPIKLKWSYKLSGSVSQNRKLNAEPIVVGQDVFILDNSAKVHCVRNGRIKWSVSLLPARTTPDDVLGSIAFDGQVIYAATSLAEAFAIEAETGKIIWRKQLNSPARGALLVYGGFVYVLSMDSKVEALSAASGDYVWSHSGISESIALMGGGGCAAARDMVIVPYASGEVFALYCGNGGQVWSQIVSHFSPDKMITSLAHIKALPVIDGNQVYIASNSGKVVSLNLANGRQLWEQSISGATQTPVLSLNSLFIITNENDLVCLSKTTGAPRWIASLPKAVKKTPVFWYGPLLAGGKLILAGSHGVILFISPIDGQVMSSMFCGAGISVPPVVANGKLYILTNEVSLRVFE